MDSFKAELQNLKHTGIPSLNESKYNSDTKDQNLDISNKALLTKIKTNLNTLCEQRNLRLIFVDGFMLFHDPELIIQYYDIKIFLISHYHSLKARREKRSGYVTQETFWVDPPEYFDKIVYPAYAKSHGYLFQGDDVEAEINPDVVTGTKQGLGLNWKVNDDGKDDIEEVLQWTYDTIERELDLNYDIK